MGTSNTSIRRNSMLTKLPGKPTKLFVQDINKKNLVYILYNEITINGLQKEDVLAFQLTDIYRTVY